MEAVGIILMVAFLIACVVCAFKESKIIGKYKVLGVFGRIKAYLAMTFTFGGLAMLVMTIASIFSGEFQFGGIIGALVCLALGLLLYWITYLKCPEFLQKRVILDMIICALGVSMKIALFFIVAVWQWQSPSSATLEDGTEVYLFNDGTAYNPSTGRSGTVSGSTITWN